MAYGLKVLLNIAWIVQIVFFGIVFFGMLVKFSSSPDYTIDGWPISVPVGSTIGQVTPTSPIIREVKVSVKEASLTFRTQRDWRTIAIAIVGVSFGFGISLVVTYQLRKIFATLTDTHLFVVGNVYRLRTIAFILMAFSPISWLLSLFTNEYVRTHFSAKGNALNFHYELDFNAILTGLVLLVIAEVFKEGVQLKEEQDLTI